MSRPSPLVEILAGLRNIWLMTAALLRWQRQSDEQFAARLTQIEATQRAILEGQELILIGLAEVATVAGERTLAADQYSLQAIGLLRDVHQGQQRLERTLPGLTANALAVADPARPWRVFVPGGVVVVDSSTAAGEPVRLVPQPAADDLAA